MTKYLHTLLILALLCLAMPALADEDLPAPVAALQNQGIHIVGDFQAAGGMTAYAGIAGNQPIAIYVVNDGQNAIVGTLLDDEGHVVGRDTVEELVAGPMSKRTWTELDNSSWIVDGDPDAPRIVYEFSDPNCPYCHLFWKKARPWVESGKVQIRHVLVGVISESSPNKAATIFTADDPSAAFAKNQTNFEDDGIEPMDSVPADVRSKLNNNAMLMRKLGIRGTPGILYKDDKGHVQTMRGVPPDNAMTTIMGER